MNQSTPLSIIILAFRKWYTPSTTLPYRAKVSRKDMSSTDYERPAFKWNDLQKSHSQDKAKRQMLKNTDTSKKDFWWRHASDSLVNSGIWCWNLRSKLLTYTLFKYIPNFSKECHSCNLQMKNKGKRLVKISTIAPQHYDHFSKVHRHWSATTGYLHFNFLVHTII